MATPIRPKAEGKKQLLSISKVMMPIVVVVISSIVAFVFIGAIQTQPHNHLPSATDEPVTTKMNTPVNTTLEGRDLDKNNTITAAIITPPSHGTLGNINQVSGVVTYTPDPRFSGKDKFTFKVNDGIADSNNVGTVSIFVNQLPLGNHPPSATDESVTTKMNTPVNTTLEGRDLDKNNTITAAIITPPSHGTLGNINQVSGVVTYTPNRNFVGNDSFTYNVNDGKIDSSNVALVKIRVSFR